MTTITRFSPRLRNHMKQTSLTIRSKSSSSFLPTVPRNLKNALTAFSLLGFVVGVYYTAIAKMSQKVSRYLAVCILILFSQTITHFCFFHPLSMSILNSVGARHNYRSRNEEVSSEVK